MREQRRVAVVTGAARGLGQAFAVRLARDGRDVVAVDLQRSDETLGLLDSLGGKHLTLVGDVTNSDDVCRLSDLVANAYDRCDILVNNAGIYPVQRFDDMTFDDWRRVHAVNLDAMFLTAKVLVPLMRTNHWGRIVNLSSNTVGLVVEGFVHYISSKSAVIGFTRALASELGNDGITVNAIAPSLTETPGTLSRQPERTNEGELSEFDMVAAMSAIKRHSVPDDLVGPMSFLTSEDSRFVTGQTLFADGGLVRG